MPNTVKVVETDQFREKLIDVCKQANDELRLRTGCSTWGDFADILIAHGVTVQEWISVKDRLPEVATSHNTRWDQSTDSIRVLCACVQADGKKMVKEGYCKVYSDGYVHWKIPGTIHSVTHWQYLPQPPKGE